jgi:hypothetical protein
MVYPLEDKVKQRTNELYIANNELEFQYESWLPSWNRQKIQLSANRWMEQSKAGTMQPK